MLPIWDTRLGDHRLIVCKRVEMPVRGKDVLQAMSFSRPSSLRQGVGMCGSLAVRSEVGRHRVSLDCISGHVRVWT